MDYQFRPFGVGVVMSHEEVTKLKLKGQEAFNSFKEKAKWTGLVSLGLGLVAAEVITRHVADGLTTAANAVADVHDAVVVEQKKNDVEKIKHAWDIAEAIDLIPIEEVAS